MAGSYKYIKVKYDKNDIPIKIHIQRHGTGGHIENYPLVKSSYSPVDPILKVWPEEDEYTSSPTQNCRMVVHNGIPYQYCR